MAKNSSNRSNKHVGMKPEVARIFEDLEDYKAFCRDYGYFYDEADLYKERGPWGDLQRLLSGRNVRNNWSQALKKQSSMYN